MALAVAAWATLPVMAAETDETGTGTEAEAESESVLSPEEFFEGGAESYPNWIEVSAGGLMTGGNNAQQEQMLQKPAGAFGGIEDFHYQRDVGDALFTMDGRALFGTDDYSIKLELNQWDKGFVRFSYDQFRTWSNGDGGYYPPTGVFYPLGDDALTLDHGDLTFEAGLRLEGVPHLTFKYQHLFRDGEKGSTIWGPAQPDLNVFRGLSPSFYDIDDSRDIFELNLDHTIEATSFGLGMRYETANLNNSRKMTMFPGDPNQTRVTNKEGTDYDFVNVHAYVESWIKPSLFLSSAFAYNHLDNDFSGSRIYGSDFDVGYVPDPANGLGYTGLNGGSVKDEYVMNLNFMARPWTHLSIVPSIRVMQEDWDADSSGTQTVGASTTPFSSQSDRDLLDVRERLDLRYTRFTNWVLYARGEWTQGDGNLNENGGLGLTAPVQRQTEDQRFFQKYTAGVNWYPARRVSLDAQCYYKINNYDYDHLLDSTPNDPASGDVYPAYLTMQRFDTLDGNLRLKLRPVRNVSLVTRYDFQYSTVDTKPDSVSGLDKVDASKLTSHVIAQNISWSPITRLFLQVAFNYVISETDTTGADYTQAILNAQNNYWVLNFNSSYALNDKTDLSVGYSYYEADNYEGNASYVSLGTGGHQHAITCGLVRRLTEQIRLNLRYGFYSYTDQTYAGNANFDSHLIYGSLQYRF